MVLAVSTSTVARQPRAPTFTVTPSSNTAVAQSIVKRLFTTPPTLINHSAITQTSLIIIATESVGHNPAPSVSPGDNKFPFSAIIGLSLGGAMILLLLVITVVSWRRKYSD
ncbi:hypothetical protein P691DRAFT_809721 [Macrolepiota fuliginosa MF-IS2]|uniref:Uncharacterized protein n=1 Tax=Macrolepiota fuliginosa MF-IS2 TaxID=1400762 RepID=A0A9P5XGU8_9AGAR|nr:hypothetical protein P691DRAFT_809721 [Macrolepiota fuliginosa MF-IS2]